MRAARPKEDRTNCFPIDVTDGMIMNEQTMGIIGRALRMVFRNVREDTSCDYQISMSYVQIYMEMIQDLLEVKNSQVSVSS